MSAATQSNSAIPATTAAQTAAATQVIPQATSTAEVAEDAINAALGLNYASTTNTNNITTESTSKAESSPSLTTSDPKQIKGADAPTKVILVHNMFDKDEETEDGWEEDIRLDFVDESSKYGNLLKVKVMSKEPGGKIFAAFEDLEGAKKCAETLAGRWFDKRQLRVEFIQDEDFPKST